MKVVWLTIRCTSEGESLTFLSRFTLIDLPRNKISAFLLLHFTYDFVCHLENSLTARLWQIC